MANEKGDSHMILPEVTDFFLVANKHNSLKIVGTAQKFNLSNSLDHLVGHHLLKVPSVADGCALILSLEA